MRSFVILACVLVVGSGCDKLRKKADPDPEPVTAGSSGPPKVAHSSTKLKGSATGGATDRDGGGSARGSAAAAGSDHAPHNMGGDGSPAFRDNDGKVHGPGGPVFMGRGVDCDAAHDHCLREGVWFAVTTIKPGRLYRAVPVYELESKWYTWRGEAADTDGKVYQTQIAGNAQLASGTPVIWFSNETNDHKWADTEYEALTSSRWEAGVIDRQESPTVVMIKGWGSAPLDSVRVITAQRDP